uniref:Uncharacterized protein n=1 Tax=viral metagenome TaxID=1070528 RepID=A0A6M3JTH0_9ZZZZ
MQLQGFKGVKVAIPGTNQIGEACQELNSFDRAFKRVEEAMKFGGHYRKCLITDHLAIVYDTGDENLFAMRLEMGSPPLLRWLAVPRSRCEFLVGE